MRNENSEKAQEAAPRADAGKKQQEASWAFAARKRMNQ
jgi:hypothetical protein